MNPFTLRFEPELEREFFADYTRDSLPFVRIMLMVGIVVTLAFGIWDHLLFPQVQTSLWAIRTGFVSPILALTIASTYHPGLRAWWQLAVAIGVATAICALILMMPILPPEAAHTHLHPGVQLVLMFAFATLKLRFVHALAVCTAGVVMFQVVASARFEFPGDAMVNSGFFMWWALGSGAIACYLLERYSRHNFLQRRENAALMRALADERKGAVEANAAKTRFLAAASHDLRQPMHTIGLLVDILRERLAPGETHALAERVHQAAQSMESMFDALLDVSKLDAGQVAVSRTPVRLAAVSRSLQSRYQPAADAKGLALNLDAVPDRALLTDPVLLERILGNLIDNAIKYTEQGQVQMRASLLDDRVRIEVNDTGCGIPPALLDRVFEEFFQAGNPERDRRKGLGLGLSIVQRSARLLGHPVHVHSIVGRGSVFSFDVALAPQAAPTIDTGGSAGSTYRDAMNPSESTSEQDDAQLESTRPEATPISSADAADLHGLFVLVIDDEAEIRVAMRAVLQSWGCIVLCVSCGAEAVSELAGHLRDPDLIICDFRLREGEDGILAVTRVRHAATSTLPAIILTGEVNFADEARVRGAGLHLARKPLHGAPLRRQILRAIGIAQGRSNN